MAELKGEEIPGLVEKHIKEALEFDEIKRILNGKAEESGLGVDGMALTGRARDLLHSYHKTDSPEGVIQIVDHLLLGQGIQADKTSFIYKRLCREMEKAQARIGEVQWKRDQGEY